MYKRIKIISGEYHTTTISKRPREKFKDTLLRGIKSLVRREHSDCKGMAAKIIAFGRGGYSHSTLAEVQIHKPFQDTTTERFTIITELEAEKYTWRTSE